MPGTQTGRGTGPNFTRSQREVTALSLGFPRDSGLLGPLQAPCPGARAGGTRGLLGPEGARPSARSAQKGP